MGAAYASLSNDINYNNSAVNKHIPEEKVTEKEMELLKQNKELKKQNEQFQKMFERLTDEITSLRKENEAIKNRYL